MQPRTQLSLIGEDTLLGTAPNTIASTQVPRCKSEWKDHWHTPRTGKVPVLEIVEKVFGKPIDVDPCTDETNPVGALNPFYQPKRNGLLERWYGANVFVNPPFSAKNVWLKKSVEEGKRDRPLILIAPSSVLHNKGTRDYCATAMAISPIGRVAFIASKQLQDHRIAEGKDPEPDSPPDNMALLYWGREPQRFANVLQDYGFWAYPGAGAFLSTVVETFGGKAA